MHVGVNMGGRVPKVITLSLVVFVCMCAHVCGVCLCVYIKTHCINISFQVANILKKIQLYKIGHLQPNGTSPICLLDLDLHFQGKNFWHFVLRISRKW